MAGNPPFASMDLFAYVAAVSDEALLSRWESLCKQEPVLASPPEVPVSPQLIDTLLKSVEVPRELHDETPLGFEQACLSFMSDGRQTGVALRQLLCLGAAAEEGLGAEPNPDVRQELRRRSQLAVETMMVFIATNGLGRLHRESYRDGLTGLLNRRAYDDDLTVELNRTDALRPSTVVQIDLDGLKAVNDTQGHPAGDALISEFAAGLASGAGGAKAYRWGGDEFAMIFSGLELCEAVRVMKQLQAELSPFSWGAVGVPAEAALTPESVNALADARLYHMKKSRKGQLLA